MKDLKMKCFAPTLSLIESFNEDQTFIINANSHHLDGCSLKLKKTDGQFAFETISPTVMGIQNHKEIQFERAKHFRLVNHCNTLYLKGDNYFVNHIDYIENHTKFSKGTINLLSSKPYSDVSNKYFLRCVIPVGTENKTDLRDFQKTLFKVGNTTSLLFTCNVDGHNFDLVNCKKDGFHYLNMFIFSS